MVKSTARKETVEMILARAKEGLGFLPDGSLQGNVHRKTCFYDGKKLQKTGDYYLLDSIDKIARREFTCPQCKLVYWNPVCNVEQVLFDQLIERRYCLFDGE